MPTDTEPTFGAALRAAREEAGRTVDEVSAHTRIRATLIRDLEGDRFASSGGTVYARGHIKAIAAAVGADAAGLLAHFDRVEGGTEPVVISSPPVDDRQPVTSFGGSAFAASAAAALTPERRGPRWGLALAGAVMVLIVVVVISSLHSGGTPTPSTALGGSVRSPSPAPSSAVVHTPNPASVASAPAVTGAQLRLRLIGGDSWVSVSNARSTLFEGLLRNGQFKDFRDATRLKVVVGNAVAVNLNCGGKDSGPAGRSGTVGHFTCTAGGLAVT